MCWCAVKKLLTHPPPVYRRDRKSVILDPCQLATENASSESRLARTLFSQLPAKVFRTALFGGVAFGMMLYGSMQWLYWHCVYRNQRVEISASCSCLARDHGSIACNSTREQAAFWSDLLLTDDKDITSAFLTPHWRHGHASSASTSVLVCSLRAADS